MNDLESRLRALAPATPPPGLRAVVLDAADQARAAAAWTWRDWFWPSPVAWGAMAAVWLFAFFISWSETTARPSPTAGATLRLVPMWSDPALLALTDFSITNTP